MVGDDFTRNHWRTRFDGLFISFHSSSSIRVTLAKMVNVRDQYVKYVNVLSYAFILSSDYRLSFRQTMTNNIRCLYWLSRISIVACVHNSNGCTSGQHQPQQQSKQTIEFFIFRFMLSFHFVSLYFTSSGLQCIWRFFFFYPTVLINTIIVIIIVTANTSKSRW